LLYGLPHRLYNVHGRPLATAIGVPRPERSTMTVSWNCLVLAGCLDAAGCT